MPSSSYDLNASLILPTASDAGRVRSNASRRTAPTMDSELHYCQGGRIHVEAPIPYVERRETGRFLLLHAVPVGVPTRVAKDSGDYLEWFSRGAPRLPYPRPPFSLRHVLQGRVAIGMVVRLVDVGPWVEAVAEIDDGPAGDAFLEDLGPDAGRLPVSIAFNPEPGGTVRWPRDPLTGLEGVQRTRVRVVEIAVVDAAQYPGAHTYARGHWAGMAGLKDSAA